MDTLTDNHGNAYAHELSVHVGDRLRADDGFTCLGEGDVCTVFEDPLPCDVGPLFVLCACDNGRHYLKAQLNDVGAFVGFYKQ